MTAACYFDLVREMKNAYNHRLRLVESAHQRGIKPTARLFTTTVPTIHKWLRRHRQAHQTPIARALTIPSVGRSFVGRIKCSNAARLSFGAFPGAALPFERSASQFFVEIRLVSVRTGCMPAGNSAVMIPSASVVVSTMWAVPPSALNLLPSVLWKGVLLMSAAGNHTRVGPEGLKTSTRVVTSNVRQPLEAASSENRRPALGNARLADTMPADRRKSRRFMVPSFRLARHCSAIYRI
jgi:hypothetical protein